MTKVYPLVVAPKLLIYQLSHRRYREAAWGMTAFVITAAVVAAPGIMMSPAGFWSSFSMQA